MEREARARRTRREEVLQLVDENHLLEDLRPVHTSAQSHERHTATRACERSARAPFGGGALSAGECRVCLYPPSAHPPRSLCFGLIRFTAAARKPWGGKAK
jgi:hypothetical protein